MRQMFNYTKFNDETADSLVMAFSALVSRNLDGQTIYNSEEYKEANTLFSKNIIEYCLEGSGAVYNDMEDIKNPMVYSNAFFKSKFATILAQAITPVVPTVVSAGYDQLFEVHQVGFGVA